MLNPLIKQTFLNKTYDYVKQNIMVKFIIQILKNEHTFPKKVYKLSKAKFSQFDRTRGDKNQIFPILDVVLVMPHFPGIFEILRNTLQWNIWKLSCQMEKE